LPEFPLLTHTYDEMDTLVARYSRPMFERDEPLEDEAQEMMGGAPSQLTTRFAMPPIAQVRFLPLLSEHKQQAKAMSTIFGGAFVC
jgi:hypothetical protein